ncbi:MAG: hypothetical protein KGL39_49550 [Patescibacteria group bacterium]|nr:hypothetical protein [Patescibacteria group bacterium]
MSDGLAFFFVVAVCVLFAVWARRPRTGPLPDFTPAEDAPAFKDETGTLPQVAAFTAPVNAAIVPLIRPRKNGAIAKCPVCKHRFRRNPCRAALKTERKHKKPPRCGCKNEFHYKKPAKRAS